MTENTRYYFNGEHYWRIDLDYDTWIDSPRDEYYSFSTIYAWCGPWDRDYIGDGDRQPYDNVYDALHSMVYDLTEKQIIAYVRSGKTAIDVEYNRHTREWEMYVDNEWYESTDQALDWLVDDMISTFTNDECVEILEKYSDIVFLPLYAVDYGCNGYRIGESWDYDRCNGLAFIDFDHTGGSKKDWRDRGLSIIRSELEEYNLYLAGDCYVATWYLYDFEDREWIEHDVVGGFLSGKWGDDLFREIADVKDSTVMYEDFKELCKAV